MDCCSPDVGDCKKCHPELWKQIKGGILISKEFPLETRPNKTLRRIRSKKQTQRRKRH